MSAVKHTPGPWHAREWQCRGVTSVGRVADNRVGFEQIAECSGNGRQVSNEQEEADARLIAAAPDLLEALKGVLRVADRKTDEFDAARAAIAKATGSAA